MLQPDSSVRTDPTTSYRGRNSVHEHQLDLPLRNGRTLLRDIWKGFRRENAAFIVTCIYLIFEYNRPHIAYPIIDIIPWGKTLLLLACFLALKDPYSSRPPAAAVLPVAVFSFCVLLSMTLAYSPSKAFDDWGIFFSWVVVVFLFTAVVRTRTRLFLFMVVYFLCNLKMAQHGFRTWVFRGFSFSTWGVTGSPGWFQNSGEFSLQMAVFLALVLAYIVAFRMDWTRSVRIFFYFLSIMAAGSIIASGSRGGILGLAMVGCWCINYTRHRLRAIIVIALAGLFVYVAMPTEFKERFETVGEDKTSLSRLRYWDYGMEAIKASPVSGVGYRNWTIWVMEKHPELIGLIGSSDRVEVIHNTYLEAATELGIVGLVAYIAILFQVFRTNLNSATTARRLNDRFLAATASGLNGCLVAYAVPSYFMSVLYYPYIWMLLSFTVCLKCICGREAARQVA